MNFEKTYDTGMLEAGVRSDLRAGAIEMAHPGMGVAAAEAVVAFFRSIPHHGKAFTVEVVVKTRKQDGVNTGEAIGFGVAVMAEDVEEEAPAVAAAAVAPLADAAQDAQQESQPSSAAETGEGGAQVVGSIPAAGTVDPGAQQESGAVAQVGDSATGAAPEAGGAETGAPVAQ